MGSPLTMHLNGVDMMGMDHSASIRSDCSTDCQPSQEDMACVDHCLDQADTEVVNSAAQRDLIESVPLAREDAPADTLSKISLPTKAPPGLGDTLYNILTIQKRE